MSEEPQVVHSVTRNMSIVVLDVVEPGVTPPYCCHGRATCVAPDCGEWVWLGHTTAELVSTGKAAPICLPCAIKLIPPGAVPFDHVKDHLRKDGPHE